MKTLELSPCFFTEDVDACRSFYQEYLGARLEFDCGWYISLVVGEGGQSLQFMQPQDDRPTFAGVGVTLNFKVDDVDAEYEKLMAAGLETVMPLEDHPWGDRGFSIHDPIGNSLYIYSDREPSDDFKKFYVA